MKGFWVTSVKIWSPLTTQKPRPQLYGLLDSMWKWSKTQMSSWIISHRISKTSQTSSSIKSWSAAWSFTCSSPHKVRRFSKTCSDTSPKSARTPTCVTEVTSTGDCCRQIQNWPRISCSRKGRSSQTSRIRWKLNFYKNWSKTSVTCRAFIASSQKTL